MHVFGPVGISKISVVRLFFRGCNGSRKTLLAFKIKTNFFCIVLINCHLVLEGSWGQPQGPNFPSPWATMLALRLDCSTAALTTPQTVLSIWKLVELKRLDFSDRTRTGYQLPLLELLIHFVTVTVDFLSLDPVSSTNLWPRFSLNNFACLHIYIWKINSLGAPFHQIFLNEYFSEVELRKFAVNTVTDLTRKKNRIGHPSRWISL